MKKQVTLGYTCWNERPEAHSPEVNPSFREQKFYHWAARPTLGRMNVPTQRDIQSPTMQEAMEEVRTNMSSWGHPVGETW